MIRKISFSILSVAILIVGAIAFSKLGYPDRSARIFSFRSDTSFEGRLGSGPEARGEFARREAHDLPDSLKARFGSGENRSGVGRSDRNIPDSLRQKLEPRNGERFGTGSFRRGTREGEGRRGGDFQGGKKINLSNVLWFMAVFAAFTVAALYIDKGISLIRKRKARKQYLAENG
jgi:hypothetical protein